MSRLIIPIEEEHDPQAQFGFFKIGSTSRVSKHVTDRQLELFLENSSSLEDFKEIELRNLTSVSAKGLVILLSHPKFSKLETLTIFDCDCVSDAVLAAIQTSNLRRLSLRSLKFITCEAYIKLLTDSSLLNLERLEFRSAYTFDDSTLAALSQSQMPNLTRLDLRKCDRITGKGLQALSGSPILPRITHLNLSQCYKISVVDLKEFLKPASLTSLSHLKIKQLTEVRDPELEEIINSEVGKQLKRLTFKFCRFTDKAYETLLKANLNSLTKLSIPLSSWYLEEILNSPAASQLTYLEIYDIRGLTDVTLFRSKQEEYGKFDILQKRIDDILSNSKYLTNLTKLKMNIHCKLSKFWKSENCLKLTTLDFIGRGTTKPQKKKSIKRFVHMPDAETSNQKLSTFKTLVVPAGSDYILGKDLSHVETLVIEGIQDVYHLATVKFQKLKTLIVSLKDDHGIERFAEIDMSPAKLTKFKINGNYNWSFLAEVIPMSKNFSSLQAIKMGVVGVSNNYLQAFQNFRNLKHLKKITLIQGSVSISALSAIIANSPKLVEISLRGCTIEEEAAPDIGYFISFKGVIKAHKEHLFENIYMQGCSFRMIIKKKISGIYKDERTATSWISKSHERPYANFSIILAEKPNWNNEETGGYYNVQRSLEEFHKYYEKDNRGISWLKIWENSSLGGMIDKPILEKCTGLKSFRSYTNGLKANEAYSSVFQNAQTITIRYLPEQDDIDLFGPFLTTFWVVCDKELTFEAVKAVYEKLATDEKCKPINSFLACEYGNKAGKQICPLPEVVKWVTTTRLKHYRYFEVPNCKFEFIPENKEALKIMIIQLATIKTNLTLFVCLFAKLIECFQTHLAKFQEDQDKENQTNEYWAPLFKISDDVAQIICFYAVNYGKPWLRQAVMEMTAPIPMTPEDIRRFYIREIWELNFTSISFLNDVAEINNPVAIDYAIKDYQAKPNDKGVQRIVDKILTKLSPEQLKSMPKNAEPGYIFRHPLFYDTENQWTFEEYSLTLRDLDAYLKNQGPDIPAGKKIVLWDKAEHQHIQGTNLTFLDCSRIRELIFNFSFIPVKPEFLDAVKDYHIKTVTFYIDAERVSQYNYSNRWLPENLYEEVERVNIQLISLTLVSAEPWSWLFHILDNIKPTCTLYISVANNGKCAMPLEIKERSSLKIKKLILDGKSAFTFFSEIHAKMKIQTLECRQIKVRRKDNDNWDQEKTDENEKKVLTYISKIKGNLDNIRLDIPLKLNSLINILQTPQWLQIKDFRIMSSGTNEELELIARAKNLSSLSTLHIDFSQRIAHGESLSLYIQGIKALISASKDIFKKLDWGRFFSVHSKYGLISNEIVKEAIKRNLFREPTFKQWTLFNSHHKFPILPENVIKVLENTDVNNFDIAYFISRNKEHDAVTAKVYSYYINGQFKNKIATLSESAPITFYDKKTPTHTTLIDLLKTDKFSQAELDGMIENQPLAIDDDFIRVMCSFADVIKKDHIVIRKLDDKHKNITSAGLNQLLKTFEYQQYPSLYKWVIDSTYYLQMADLENLGLLSTRDVRFFDIKKIHLSSHKFLYPQSTEDNSIMLHSEDSAMIGQHNAMNDDAKNKRDTAILGLICQCQSLQWLHLDKLNLDDVFCMKLAVLHNEKLKNKNKLQLISIKENPFITYVGLKFLYSIPIADEAFQQSHYGIIANCDVILDVPSVVALNDGIHAAIKSKFREYKRKKKARGLHYYDHNCIPLILYSIVCFPFAFFQYYDEEIAQTTYLNKIRKTVAKAGDKIRGILNMQAKKAEYVYFADMDDEQDKESGNRLRYIFSKGCIQLNKFLSKKEVWGLLYVLHALLYYFFAIFFPLKFISECDSATTLDSHIAYGVYAAASTISEAWLLRKAVKIINDDQVAQFKFMVVVPLALSQNNKLSLYTDVMYLTTAYSCGSRVKAIISTVSLLIFLVMNAIEIFNLLKDYISVRRGGKSHNSTYIDLIGKFCYSMDLTTISALLEKVSICCADQVGRVYVPQILQSTGLKSMTRTFPQAILQLTSYLSSGLSNSSVVYLVSFVVSIVNLILAFYSLITVQPSACTPATLKKVFYKDFKSHLQQKEESPRKKKPKKITPTIIEAETMTPKEDKKPLAKCFKNLKQKIEAFKTKRREEKLLAKMGECEKVCLKEDAAIKENVLRYEESVAKLKVKYTRKGIVTGFYLQGGPCPIEGTYTLVDGVLNMRSEDSAGAAKWDGVISIFTGVAKIAKRYEGRHFVGYNGDVNWDNEEDVEVNGMWSMGGGGSGFQLVFKKEPEVIEEKIEEKSPGSPVEAIEETQLIEKSEKDEKVN